MENSNMSLTSLAMLKVNAESSGKDYIEYLAPFVNHILITSKIEIINDKAICDQIKSTFFLNFPVRMIQLVLRRFSKKGYLKLKDGVYKITESLPKIDIRQKKEDAVRKICFVIKSLCDYAKEKHEIEWIDEKAAKEFIAFLSHFSIECLMAYSQNTAIPKTSGGSRDQYITCSFIREAHDDAPELFENIIVFVKGYMLSNALLCPDLESIQKKFDVVFFYLDTPFVLRLLNLQGEIDYTLALDLVNVIKKLNGTVAVFKHTLDEVKNVISWCEDHIEDFKFNGPILREMRRQGRKKVDLMLIKNRIEEFFLDLQIKLIEAPSYKINKDFQIDEAILQEAIEEEIHYGNSRALEFDINSIRSIYALRKKETPIRLEDAAAVLVTTNTALAKAAYDFGKQSESSYEVSSVITDFSLANIAWLKSPLESPSLPIQEVLATCYSALNPTETLWTKYIKEIDNLKNLGKITPDDHALLRGSDIARDVLMGLTLGEESALTEKTVVQIIETVKEKLSKEYQEKLEQEQLAHKETTSERDELLQFKNRIENNLISNAKKKSQRWAKVSFYTLVLLVLIGSSMSPLVTSSFVKKSFLFTALLNTVLLLFFIWGILRQIFGWSVRSFSKTVEIYLYTHFLNKLKKKIIH